MKTRPNRYPTIRAAFSIFRRDQLPAEELANVADVLELSAPAEIEAALGDDPERLATFDALAYTGAAMRIEGYKFPVVIDLAGMTPRTDQLPALRGHDDNRVVGHSTAIDIGADGVRVRGVISGTSEAAREVVANAKNGFRWQISLGSTPVPGSVRHLPAKQTATINGQEFTGPLTVVKAAQISELSFVPRGADHATSAAIAAQIQGTLPMFEKWLEAQGFDIATLTETQLASLRAAFTASQTTPNDDQAGSQSDATATPTATAATAAPAIAATAGPNHQAPDLEAIVASAVTRAVGDIEARHQTSQRLEQICAGQPDILAQARQNNWSTDRAELEVERRRRPSPILAHSDRDGAPQVAHVIEAAMLLNGSASVRPADLEAFYDDNTIEAAQAAHLRGFGLHALMHEVARAAGRHLPAGTTGDSLIRAAFEGEREIRASGIGNVVLTNTLGNIANKAILLGFNATEQAWRRIAKIGSTKDFKQRTSLRLTGDFTYEEVGKNGQLHQAELGETAYTNQAKTYGKIFGIDRQTLVNDDLQAVEDTARLRIGRGAGLKINSVFWTEFLNNSTFFTAARGNYDDGTDTVLNIAGLSRAEAMFMDLEDENGDPTNLDPTLLLVPTGHSAKAAQLYNSTEVRDTTATTEGPTANPHSGKFEPVVSRYLNKSAYTGYSALAWYLLADPMDAGVGVIEVLFLNGQQSPTVETSTLDFDQLGIQMRGFHDFGVAKQEYRCGVKFKGEA